MITNQDMIIIINNRIANIDFHIDILSRDTNDYPDSDIEGKPTRQSVLDELLVIKLALEQESLTISNKMI